MRFDRAANDLFDRANRFDTGEIEATAAVHLDSMLSMTEQLRQMFAETEDLPPERLTKVEQTELPSITESLESFKQTAAVLLAKLQEDLEQTGETLRALKKEQESLEKGRFQFPQNALDLKQAILSQINAKHNESAEVVLVAEASEIKNDRWRNAIEGYLNTQKYYIIVPPQYVRLAVKVFDRIKRDKAVYDTGIVDTEKILKKHPRAEQNSLAREIETDNPNVRAYLDYLLGRVIKCDHAEHIRDYPISITDEGLLYKNYVVRALNPKLWQHPAIGQNAIILRLNEIKREIAANNRLIETYSSLKVGATACKDTEGYSQSNSLQGYRGLFAKRRRAADECGTAGHRQCSASSGDRGIGAGARHLGHRQRVLPARKSRGEGAGGQGSGARLRRIAGEGRRGSRRFGRFAV